MDANLQYVDGMFKTNNDLVAKAITGIPAEQWGLKPGDGSNHLLWVMGHLVWARGVVLKTLGADVSLHWAPQFARGAKCEGVEQYPKVEEVCSAWTDFSTRLATCLAEVPTEVLATPHDKPTFDGKVSGFVAFLAYHEAYHVGQLSYLRKWLGHGQLTG